MKSLKDSEREEILRRLNSNETMASLSREFGISARSISRMKKECSDWPTEESRILQNSDEPRRKKQKNLELKDKEEIIDKLIAGEKMHILAADYDVSVITIRRIREDKDEILAKIDSVKNSGRSLSKKMIHGNESLLNKAMDLWFKQERSLGHLPPGNLIREKAKLLNKELNGPENFKASNGWLAHFKEQYGSRHVSATLEKLSPEQEAVDKFVTDFNKFLLYNSYTADQVYNADETGLYWRELPNKTHSSNKVQRVLSQKEVEDRVTIMLCANVDGTHKIPLLVVGKTANNCSDNTITERLPVNYAVQTNAWMNQTIFFQWYKKLFIPEVRKQHPNSTEHPRKVLLLLDNATSHPSLEELNIIDSTCQVMYLPPYVAAGIQPMAQGIIDKTKMMYKENLLRDLVLQEELKFMDQKVNSSTLKDACYHIYNAWDSVLPKDIEKAWNRMLQNKNCTDNAEDCYPDVMEMLQILQRVPGFEQSSYEEIKRWIEADQKECGWQILGIKQIAKRIINGSAHSEEDETCEAYNEFCEPPSPQRTLPETSEALKAAATLFDFMGSRSEFTKEDLVCVKRLQDRLSSLL